MAVPGSKYFLHHDHMPFFFNLRYLPLLVQQPSVPGQTGFREHGRGFFPGK